MSIKYKVQEMRNPRDLAAPHKFYAKPVSSGEVTLDELSEDISHASSVNQSDVYAVLQSLVREIPKNIARGNIVRLGNLGTFRLGSNSEGSELAEEVSPKNLLRFRLLFHPGKQIKTVLDNLTFEKVA